MLSKFRVRAPIRPMSSWDRLMFSRVKRNQLVARPARVLSRNQILFPEHFLHYSFPAELPLKALTRKLYLFGYLQSHRIPDAIEPELREHLTFRDAPTGRTSTCCNRFRLPNRPSPCMSAAAITPASTAERTPCP